MNIVAETDDKLQVDVRSIFKEEIENVKFVDCCQSTDILQRIWAKALNHVYKRDTESFESVAQFVLQHTESMLFGFNWSSVPSHDVQQIEEHITQWLPSLKNPILRDKCQHILDHIHSPHSHPILNKLKREKLTKDWLEDAIQYLMMETGSTIVQRLKVYASFPDYSMIIQYAKNCWHVISSLSLDHPLSKAISVDEFYSILAYHLTSMYTTVNLNYIFQVIINMEITDTLKLMDRFPKISGEMEVNSEVVIDLLYRYHFNEFLRSTDSNASVDEHLMVLTNSYCQRYKHKSSNEFGALILDIASTGLACPTRKLFIVLHVIQNECPTVHMNFKLRLAYLGLTHDFNQLELKKADIDCDKYDIMAAEAELSEFFVFLCDVLIKYPEIHRECILTAFTLNPSQQLYEKLKDIASSQGLDAIDGMPKGSIPAITNTGYLVSLNYNPFESPNCIMDTNEIDMDVREDLSRAITHPRLKFISWGMPYDEFCDICEKLMTGLKKKFTKNVVASANEMLEHVDIDFSLYENWPEKEGDDGIEKGYHIFLDDDDTSEEDDDKTMTSPEAAELIKEAEIKLKKKKMILKRKSTICKKLMKSGMPTKKILMKAPPKKIPRPGSSNRIDWKHIEELKEYFKEHSHLIKATQMFNDAQTLIDKLNEMSANNEQPPQQTAEKNCTSTAIGGISGDLNLNIIPIDPNTGVVINNNSPSSTTEHENFPNTSLVLPTTIDQNTHIADTSNHTAIVNIPTTPSTSMTLQNPCDPVAEITKQLIQLLDEVDADLRLNFRRQKNCLAGIKRRMIKKGGYVETTNIDAQPKQISSIKEEIVVKTEELPTELSLPAEERTVNPIFDVKIEEFKKEENFDAFIPQNFDNVAPLAESLVNFTPITEPATYDPFHGDNKDFVNAFIDPIIHSFIPNHPIDEKPLSLPIYEQTTNHYDEIINMVASSYVDDGCDSSSVVKPKNTKKRKKTSPAEPCMNGSTISQTSVTNSIGTTVVPYDLYANPESNGYAQYTDSSTVSKPEMCNDPNASQFTPVDGEAIKKPRKGRGKNKPKKPEADQSMADTSGDRHHTQSDVQHSEGDRNPVLSTDVIEPKKVKAPRNLKPMPRLSDGSIDGAHLHPNTKLSDLPDDLLIDRGKLYADSIERAIQRVMAGDDIDITPTRRSSNTDEMTLMEIDGVLDNILNMNSGGALVSRDDSKTTVTNHNRNDSTIEQDYTENFDLALTNDNLYQEANGPVASSSPVEDDKNKVTILSELLADEPQYFSTGSIGEDNCNSSNLINTSTDSTGNYSSDFNGFAELISPKSIKAECQTECAFTPSDNCASYTDISYNTKPCSRLSAEINDGFVKRESGVDDVNNGQSSSNHFGKCNDERLQEHYPGAGVTNYNKMNNDPVNFQQRIASSDFHRKGNNVENVRCPPLVSMNAPIISPPPAQNSIENVPKVNGIKSSAKSERLTSSLRLIRKPNHYHRQSSSLFPLIKTKKLSIRVDPSIVDDFISSQRKKKTVRLLQPIVVLKRLEDEENEPDLLKKTSRSGKRKQNRATCDGVTVEDKRTFKRRRDDMDDAEGSSGFTGGSSGSSTNGYSSDSQSGTSVDSPPPKAANGGANDSIENKLVSCSVRMTESDCFWERMLANNDDIDFQRSYSGKLNYQKVENFCNKDVDLTSSSSASLSSSAFIQSSSNCNLVNSVCDSANKLSYFKPIQTSAKFATLDTVLTHFMTLNKLSSILKPCKATVPQSQSNYMPNLLKSVPGVETFEHFLAPAHHRYQTVEIVQLAKQLLPTSGGECNENDDQRNASVLSTESTSKIVPTIDTNIDFRQAVDSAASTPTPTISRPTTTTTKSNNVIITAQHQQVVTPTTITPHIQKTGQPTSCSTVSFNRTTAADSVTVPTSRNNSVAVVFVKNSDGQQHQSVDSIKNSKRPESTVIRNNSEQQQQQQKVVQLTTQLSQNQQNSPQLAKILNKPMNQTSSQPHLLQILNAPPSRNLNNNLFTATATNGNIVSGGNSGNIMTFSGNNGGSTTLPNNLYICKTDGKTIQLTPLTNNRLMTASMSNVKTALNGFYINNNLKKTVNQVADEVKIASTTASMETVVQSSKNSQAAQIKSQINTRSVYEENYAKFIQTASQKSSNDGALKIGGDNSHVSVTTSTIQSNVLPKFNHVFGKTIFSSDTISATQTKTTTSTITLTVSDDDNDPNIVSVSQDAATQTNAFVHKGKQQKKFLQTLVKDSKMISDSSFANEKLQKQQSSANHVIYSRQMPVLASTQQFSQSTIVQGINRMIQASGGTSSNTTTTVNKNDIKIIHQPMSSIATGMRISMPIVSSSMQQIQTKLIRPVIQLPPTILRSTGQGEHRQQFLITTPSDPSSNVRYENLIVTAQSPAQSSSNRNVDTSTLEQLREFDMVLEQVKERSTTTLIATTPSSSTNIAVNAQSVSQLITSGNSQIIQTGSPDIIYTTSNGQSVIQKLNLAYVQQHNLHNAPLVVVRNYCQPPLSSSSNASQKVSTVTSSIATLTSPKSKNAVAQLSTAQTTLKLTPKIPAKSVADKTVGVTSMLPKYTSTITAVTNSISSTTPITTTNVVNNNNASISISSSSTPANAPKPPPKLQEDEQTVQRIYNILAEYAEQLRNSPDLNNKPAPRRRCNIPSNTSTTASSSNASTASNASSTSKKRKSSQSSSSKRSTHDNELDRTLESEDSSGVSLHDQNNSDDASQHSLSNAIEKSPPVLVTSVPNSCIELSSGVLTPIAARSTTVSRQLIFADSVMTLGSSVATSNSTSTVSHSRQGLVSDSSSTVPAKVSNETVLMPRNYVLPMSVIKSGGQQYAIVASSAQASKLLESGQIKHVSSELWQQQQRSNQQGAIVLQGFLNKNVVRTGAIQTEAVVKQPFKVHKPNPSQSFSNIEVGNRSQGNNGGGGGGGGAFILQTIPTTMMTSQQSTILTNLVSSETQSQSLSAFARVPQQQSKQCRSTEASVEEQPSRGIIIIENVKEAAKQVDSTTITSATTTTTMTSNTLVAKKRKFSDNEIGTCSPMTQSELKWSSDQYLDQSQCKSVYLVDSTDSKVSTISTSPTQILSISAPKNATASTEVQKVTTLTPTTSCSDENLRYLISNPYQACTKVTKNDPRNKHLRNNFILNTNGSSSSGNRILLQQLCHERKQAAIERELRLQKSLSEECEDLGVGEPSTSDLFPEADLLFDTCSPAFDQDTSTPCDTSKQRVFFQTLQANRSNDGDDSKSDDDDRHSKLNKVIVSDNSLKGPSTPIFLRSKDDTMTSSDFGVISPYVQENSSSSSGGTNDKSYLEPIEIKKEETDNEDTVNDDSEPFNSDSTGDFDKLKNSMDWVGGPKKTYSKSSVRVLKRSQEYSLTPITKTITTSETQPTLISLSSPATTDSPTLHQRRITQYHNKKKIQLNHRLGAIQSPKNDVIIIQRKRHIPSDKSTNEKANSSTIIPYIHNHSIGSSSGSISSSFKIINSTTTTTDSGSDTLIPPSSNAPKIINHQMRRCNNQTVFDDEMDCGTTLNGSNVKAVDSAASTPTPTISRPTTTTTKSNNVIITAQHQQVVTPTTITPHIQKIGQPTSCSTVSFNRTTAADSVTVPTSRNNSVAVVFVKNSDGQQHQSVDSIKNSKRPESTVIRNNSEQQQQQQKVVQLTTQLSQNQQNSPQLAKILNKPMNQTSSQPHLLQILNAPPSRNLNNNLFTATATNGNIVSGGNSGNIMTFSGNNGGSTTLPNNLYICKTDGKTIQLTPLTNNRLMTASMSNVKTALNGFYINNNLKKTVNQVADEVKIASTTASMETVVQSSKNSQAAQIKSQINTRSVYEENYAKFIQTASQKSSNDGALKIGGDNSHVSVTTSTIQSNVLPKFNHVFGKTIFSSDTISATQTKTTTSTITLTVSDDDNDPNIVSVSQDAATQTNAFVHKGKQQKKFLQTLVKDSKMISDSSFANEKLQKQQSSANHVIYSRQMPVLASTQQFSQSTIVQGINRMIQASGGTSSNTTTTVNKNDIKIIHQPMSSIATGMRISMPIVSSSMQQIQTKLIRPVIQLPPTILRSTGQGEHRQQFLITTPSDPSSNVRYENLIVTAQSPAQSSSNRNVDTSTLEQLREFDMVLEQVKERSTTTLIATTPSSSTNIAVNAQSVSQLITSGNSQIIQTGSPDIIYTTSNGQSVIQKLNLAYVQQHNLHNAPLVVVRNYCQPPLSSSSNASQKVSTVTSSIATLTSPKSKNAVAQLSTAQTTLKLTPKIPAKSVADKTVGVTSMLPKYTSTITAVTNSISSTTPITTTNVVNNNNASISISSSSTPANAPKPPPKLQEDEQTVQRIYNILAEYAEQLRNSPDLNNKPAPRRRCNIPSNTSTTASSSNASTASNASSTSKKRKSSQSSSSKRSTHDNELDRTLESEDSSGVSLHDQNNSDDASQHSLSNAIEKSPPVLVTSVPNSCIELSSGVLTPIAARSTTVSRQLIFADSVMTLGSSVATSNSTSTVSHSRQGLVSDSSSTVPAKVSNETVLMPRNYVLPMSVIKSGGQQYAIVASSAQASKLLESGQIKHVSSELWQQQQRSNQQGAIVLQGFLNKNVVRTGAIQTEAVVKQPFKVHKPNPSQSFSNIEVGNRSQGNNGGGGGGGGAFILQTIPTTMMTSQQSTILTNLVSSETQSQSLSAFARVPQQQSKQCRSTEASVEEQPSRGIIIIENVKEAAKQVDSTTITSATTTTTMTSNTLVAKKRKFSDNEIGTCSPMTQSELKWSSDQYLDQSQCKSVYLVDSTDSKVSTISTSPTQILSISAPKNATASTEVQKVTTLTPTTSCSDENLRYLISNPYQACTKVTKNDPRNKHLRNNFILNTNGSSSSGNRILLQQLCHERKQAAIERELRLQKSLSEECEDLGVGEPSTSDLFPEADLLFDTCSPAFDQDTSTPCDTSKQRVFFQTLQANRSNDGDDSKSDDDDRHSKLNKVIVSDNSLKGPSTPIFLRSKDDTMTSSDFGVISPYVQENSSSSSGGTNDKSYLEPIEIKKEETDNEDTVNDDSEPFNSDSTGDFDKLKNSMDWVGGPKKTYSKSSVRVLKRSQEYSLTPITKTITTSETQPTLISLSSPATTDSPTLHQRRITQYHNKKKIQLNHRLGAIQSPKNDVIIIQRKRHIPSDKSTNEKANSSTIIPYIHNHSIGSSSGSISSSFKIINSTTTTTDSGSDTLIPPSSNAPKIINHQMRRCNNQTVFDDEMDCGTTLNGSNVKVSKQMKRR